MGKFVSLYIVSLKVVEPINDIEDFVQRSWVHDFSGRAIYLPLIVDHSWYTSERSEIIF